MPISRDTNLNTYIDILSRSVLDLDCIPLITATTSACDVLVNSNCGKLFGGRKESGDTSVFGITFTILRSTPAKKSLKLEAILEGDEII
jgi:hypothetical protein